MLAYDVPKPKDPSVWVRGEFARLGAQATDDAARRLVEIAGDDVAPARAGGGEARDVGRRGADRRAGGRAAGRPRDEAPAWALSDAWGSRDVGEVLAACEAELEKGVEPFLIAVRLAAQVGLVRAVQALADEGLGAREIAGRLKKHEFRVPQGARSRRALFRDELDAAVVRLAELDAALKGASRVSNELELERALLEITAAREPVAPQ